MGEELKVEESVIDPQYAAGYAEGFDAGEGYAQSRIDRAVAVLENPSKYNHEIRVEALKILKGEA